MNKKIFFSFTLDYELMGNGDGDVYELMVNPTYKFLKVCDKYNIKSTIFFEVVEYWKIKEAFQKGLLKEYRTDPTLDIENQLRTAIKNGHDVQLHIHPQWLDATYDNGKWIVNDNLHRLPVLAELGNENEYSLTKLIREGKNTLEKLFKPINENYRCHIFRAGGLNIYPSNNILKALRANGFDTDSSVFPYAYADTIFTKYDFRNVTNKNIYWITNSGILTNPKNIDGKNSPFLELPILSLLIKRYKKYDLFRIYNKLFSTNATTTTKSRAKDKLVGKNVIQKVNFFLEEESLTWDFCLFSKNKHKKYLNFIKNEQFNNILDIRPVILIGHSKEINNKNIHHLEWLIKNVFTNGFQIKSLNYISQTILPG